MHLRWSEEPYDLLLWRRTRIRAWRYLVATAGFLARYIRYVFRNICLRTQCAPCFCFQSYGCVLQRKSWYSYVRSPGAPHVQQVVLLFTSEVVSLTIFYASLEPIQGEAGEFRGTHSTLSIARCDQDRWIMRSRRCKAAQVVSFACPRLCKFVTTFFI